MNPHTLQHEYNPYNSNNPMEKFDAAWMKRKEKNYAHELK